MRFSIIIVSLNPGEKLKKTLESIFCQTYTDYEIVIKDGGSKDGSADIWRNMADGRAEAEYGGSAAARVHFFNEPDTSIYDAMNQAVSHAKGEFLLFLNCGDLFAEEKVLEKAALCIDRENKPDCTQENKCPMEKTVFYGDTLSEKNNVVIAAAPEITGFTCYRNIPCHQSCFYSADLCREKPYELQYKVRADYDHFLWCFYRAKAKMRYLNFPVAVYEGGGYSESRKNMRRDNLEHREITKEYMTKLELLRYRAVMALTLAPLRRKAAENKLFSGIYHRVKEKIYRKKRF